MRIWGLGRGVHIQEWIKGQTFGVSVLEFGVEAVEFRVKVRHGSGIFSSLPDAKHKPKGGWEFGV